MERVASVKRNRASVLACLMIEKRGYHYLMRRGGLQTLPPLGVSHARFFAGLKRGLKMALLRVTASGVRGADLLRGWHTTNGTEMADNTKAVFGVFRARAGVCAKAQKVKTAIWWP